MTTDRLARMRQNYANACHRAERAAYYGDRAGQLIAAADARRILRAAIAAETMRADSIR